MPRVPTYQHQVSPQFQPLQSPAPQAVPSGAFGGDVWRSVKQVGQQVQQAGAEAFDIAVDMRRRDDIYETKKAYLGTQEAKQNLLYGDNGLLTRMGQNADGVYDEAEKGLKAIGEQARKSLGDPAQQQRFDALWAEDMNQALGTVLRHRAEQRRSGEIDTTKALTRTALNDYVAGVGNPQAQALAWDKIIANVKSLGKLSGWDEEQTRAVLAEQETAAHKGVVTSFLARNDPQTAREYYEAHKDGISGLERPALEAKLKAAAQTWNKTVGEQGYVEQAQALGVSVEKQIQWVRQHAPAELREGVESRLWADASHRQELADKARSDAERNTLGQVVDMLHKGVSPGKVMDFIETSPGISPAQKFEWRSHVAEWGKVQTRQADDPDTARDLWGRIGADDPDKAKLAILQARLSGKLTETTKDQMIQSAEQLADIYAPELKAIASMAHQAYSKGIDVPGDTVSVAAEARVNQYARLLASDMRAKGKTLLEIKQALSPETFAPPIIEQFRPSVREQFSAWSRRISGKTASTTPTEQTVPAATNVPLSTDKPKPEVPWPAAGATVDESLGRRLLNAAKGDKDQARELARQKGYLIPRE